MPDAKAIADKYISRGGGSPTYDQAETVDDILAVAGFLCWNEPGTMFGGYKAGKLTTHFADF